LTEALDLGEASDTAAAAPWHTHEDAIRADQWLQAVPAALHAVSAYADASPVPTLIERLEDLTSIGLQARNLARNTTTELLVTFLDPGDADGWQACDLLSSSWVSAGVTVNALYYDMRDEPALLPPAFCLSGSTSQVRTTRNLPPVVIISDRQAALIPSDPTSPGNGALCVRDPAIVACLTALFSNAWHAAIPLYPPPDMSPRERTLLKHLGDGLTVQAAARKLGISQRTAARDVAALMKMLDANSPFQAGCEAVRRGWA
jgi:DNA-binding CsgD family transcriptional regulator